MPQRLIEVDCDEDSALIGRAGAEVTLVQLQLDAVGEFALQLEVA
jgi:hypothetical protein